MKDSVCEATKKIQAKDKRMQQLEKKVCNTEPSILQLPRVLQEIRAPADFLYRFNPCEMNEKLRPENFPRPSNILVV
jgi:hypothetical protein